MMERDYRIKICIESDGLLPLAKEVAYGVEEEGLFSDCVIGSDEQGLKQQTFDLACSSPLEIAVGIKDTKAFVLHRKVQQESPILLVKKSLMNPASLRILGQNAARLVVGKPLINIE